VEGSAAILKSTGKAEVVLYRVYPTYPNLNPPFWAVEVYSDGVDLTSDFLFAMKEREITFRRARRPVFMGSYDHVAQEVGDLLVELFDLETLEIEPLMTFCPSSRREEPLLPKRLPTTLGGKREATL